jgi:hypothetical protein
MNLVIVGPSPGEGDYSKSDKQPHTKAIAALQACATYCTCLQGPSLHAAKLKALDAGQLLLRYSVHV